ncbi:MAG: hypothetical protein HY327_07315 [Chloroflexi bacterium]|nr:hypothetical protein [Chloroflexota bacterium]
MELAQIDQWAVGGASAWHRASTLAKILSTTLLLGAVIVATDWRALAAIYAALFLILAFARLPVFKIALIAAYPALFSILFALSATGGIGIVVLIFARGCTAALAMLLLITTTPYVEIFAALGRVLPALIADGLFATYRAFFILLETFARLVTSVRLRGGYSRWKLKSMTQMAEVIGVTFLHALDLAEQSHAALHLRGYAGKIPASDKWRRVNANDGLPVMLGVGAVVVTLLVR